jgi:hypothetical protein
LETRPEHFLRVLEAGKVSTNVYLRRIHNFALDMTWLPWPVLAKKRWPAVEFKEKRGITLAEHLAIVAREHNPERKAFYKLAWHLGASQSDLAFLEAENVDWDNHVISYKRMKTDTVAIMRFDEDMAEILRDLPGSGPLFPYLRTVRAGDRATEFKQRCDGLGIKGVSLHSYRYAWAERAKTAGYPERYAQVNLGHNSKAMTRAYSRKASSVNPVPSNTDQPATPCSRGHEPPLAAKDLGGPEWEQKLIRELRSRHYEWRTEQAYRMWARRFSDWLDERRGTVMLAGEIEIKNYLSDLATRERVAVATQRQALNAMVFLVREALGNIRPATACSHFA